MSLYAINLQTNFITFGQAYYENGQVIESKVVETSSISINSGYRSNGKLNTLRVRLQDGTTIPVNIGDDQLPPIGSYIQLKVHKNIIWH